MSKNIVATNRKAYRDYEILESVEAGIVLRGDEVKSLRENRVNIKDSFARVTRNNEIFLYNMHISPYENADSADILDPVRVRKLLLHKREIIRFLSSVSEKGLALIPVKVYFKRSMAKVELALAKGKRKYDKRDKITKKIHDREIRRLK